MAGNRGKSERIYKKKNLSKGSCFVAPTGIEPVFITR